MSLSLTASSVKFTATGNSEAQIASFPPTIGATITNGSGTYYGTVVSDNNAVLAQFNLTGSTSGNISPFFDPARAATSSGSGHFTVKVCADVGCLDIVTAQSINYSYVDYQPQAYSVTLTALANGAPVTASIPISPASTAGALSVDGVSVPWLSASVVDGQLQLSANPDSLPPAAYFGSVGLTAGGVGTGISVTLIVGAAVGIAPQNLSVTAATASNGLTAFAPVVFGAQTPTNGWSAASDSAWLTINTPTGVAGQSVSYTVNAQSLIAAGYNWSTQTAHITLTSPGLVSETVPVVVNLQLPEIYLVTSGPSPSGAARSVVVSGRGFSQVNSGSSAIQVAGATGATTTVQSDTSATISLPALAAGNYTVSATNTLGFDTAMASAVVADATQQPYAVVTGTNFLTNVTYDASRSAIVAVESASSATLTSFVPGPGGSWTTIRCGSSVSGYTLEPVAGSVVVFPNSGTASEINPSTCATIASLPNASIGPSQSSAFPLTSNHRIWLGGVTYLDLDLKNNVQDTTSQMSSTPGTGFEVDLSGSGDGEVVVSSISGTQPGVIQYNASDDTFSLPSQAPASGSGRLSFNHSVLLQGQTVYVPNATGYSLIGQVPADSGYTASGGAVSADGSRVYTLEANTTAPFAVDHISAYDRTSVIGGMLQKMGQIAVTDQANQPCGAVAAYCTYGNIVIDPFGLNLYWTANSQVIVFPIPTGLQQLNLAAN